MAAERIVGEPCPVCNFKFQKLDADLEGLTCSEFCLAVTEEELAAFQALKHGEWGVWPCPRCGCPTEGEFEPPDLICAACAPKRDLENRTALLHETEQELHRVWAHLTDLYRFAGYGADVNTELRKAIEEALGVKEDGGKRTSRVYELRERIKDELGLIPSNMFEAKRRLDGMLSDEDREFIQKAEDVDGVIARLHHSFGRYLRNEWRLWHGSKMAKHLQEEHGIEHPDDMSHFILREYANDRIRSWHQRIDDDIVG